MKFTPKELFRSSLLILLGAAVYAFSFDWAYAPNGIAMGGVTGIAQILHFFFPRLTVGGLVIVMNVPIFLVGWRVLGSWFLISSLAAMTVSSLFIDALNACFTFTAMADPLLASIFGGVLQGLGLGLIFLQGSTTGGSDIVSRLVQRRLAWIPMGKVVMGVDLIVITLVALVFKSLNSALYGVAALYVSTLAIDAILYGTDRAKVAYIISDKNDEICAAIVGRLDRGVTILHGQGAYTGAAKKVLMCAFSQRQIVDIKKVIEGIDPGAFLIVTNAHEVLGEGFHRYDENGL